MTSGIGGGRVGGGARGSVASHFAFYRGFVLGNGEVTATLMGEGNVCLSLDGASAFDAYLSRPAGGSVPVGEEVYERGRSGRVRVRGSELNGGNGQFSAWINRLTILKDGIRSLVACEVISQIEMQSTFTVS